MRKIALGFFIFSFFNACPASSLVVSSEHFGTLLTQDGVKTKMLDDITFLKGVFETSYAPAEWKMQYSGWDLGVEIQKAKDQVLNNSKMDVKAYHRVLRELFNTTKDYHVAIHFYSTESAYLPFLVQGVKGRYFFTDIDRSVLPDGIYPFAKGDELLLFNGEPTHSVVTSLKSKEQRSSNESTDQALAEIFLTNRFGFLGICVPKGSVSITVQTAEGKVRTHQLFWEYNAERISHPTNHLEISKSVAKLQPNINSQWLEDLIEESRMDLPLYRALKKNTTRNGTDMVIGEKESFLPPLGKKLWKAPAKVPYNAYLFAMPNRKLVGYIRIPHYNFDEEDTKEFADIIRRFEDTSDMLVIDQLNNPGGSFFHAYALASMLSEDPLITCTHRVKLNQERIHKAIESLDHLNQIESDEDARDCLGNTIMGYTVSLHLVYSLRSYYQFLIDQWNEGKILSDPIPLCGLDSLTPNNIVQYTKPILLLINHLDFSCGDFFPALLQDNKRAVLFGTKTAGAGGFVLRSTYPNYFGIEEVSYTASLAERVDHNPIENIGVKPDIVYELKQEDLQNNYKCMTKAILDALNSL